MAEFYTPAEIANIIKQGQFEIGETARPAFEERIDAAAGACVEAADSRRDARLLRSLDAKVGRELKKLASLTKRLQRMIGDGPIQTMLDDGPTSRMKMRGSPKLLHDKPYLELLSTMRNANSWLDDLRVRIEVAEQCGKRNPIKALVQHLTLIWEDYKGEPLRLPVDWENRNRVKPHPFFDLVHASVQPLREKYSGIPKTKFNAVRLIHRRFMRERNTPTRVSMRAELVKARKKLASFDLIENHS